MITIKLLGGAKKAVGKGVLSVEKESMTINEILQMLSSISSNSNVFNSNNMLIAINGVESSILGGINARVSTGDVVSIIPVVHGGHDYN